MSWLIGEQVEDLKTIENFLFSSTNPSFLSLDDQYDRNHGPIPYTNAEEHFLLVDGNVKSELRL